MRHLLPEGCVGAQVWERLTVMAEKRPIAGNRGGSSLTMFSSPGLVFGVLQVGNYQPLAKGSKSHAQQPAAEKSLCRHLVTAEHEWAALPLQRPCKIQNDTSCVLGLCANVRNHVIQLQVISAFGTVFVDQAYWQSAIAARPSASVRGYLLGGLLWFSIPFTLATSIGELAGSPYFCHPFTTAVKGWWTWQSTF